MNFQASVIFLSVVLGVAGVTGIAYAVFRSSATKETLVLLKTENEIKDTVIIRQSTDIVDMRDKIRVCVDENTLLKSMVTGSSVVEQVMRKITSEEVKRAKEHNMMLEELTELKDHVESLGGIVKYLRRDHGDS